MIGIGYGVIGYADDLVLLAPSIAALTRMISIYCAELETIDLKLNCDKSCCLKIGPCHAVQSDPILSKLGMIKWVKETKYLGLKMVSHRTLRFRLLIQNANFIRLSMPYIQG